MSIALFDVQAGFGGPAPWGSETAGPDEWLAEMRRLDIARSLVHTTPDDSIADAPAANEELYAACKGHPELVPCPILIPNGGHDLPPEEDQVARAISEAAGAAFLRPQKDHWELDAWCSGPLFQALEARGLPAYCENMKFALADLAKIAQTYPELPVILAKLHYLQQRSLVPLLKAFPNVHVSIGSNYVVYQGLEMLVDEVGADRLLFGTGFPDAEPMGAVTMLTYAGISDEAKQRIGAHNLERLMEGIRQ